jgi:hypothetical protein
LAQRKQELAHFGTYFTLLCLAAERQLVCADHRAVYENRQITDAPSMVSEGFESREDLSAEDQSLLVTSKEHRWRSMSHAEHERRSNATSIKALLIVAVLCSLLASFTTWSVFWSVLHPKSESTADVATVGVHSTGYASDSHKSEHEPLTECGTTRAEAVAQGCVFDIMGVNWLPPTCFDDEFSRESLSSNTTLALLGGAGPTNWFLDFEHTQPITADEVALRDELWAYASQSFHIAHCIYMWRLGTRAIARVRNGESPVYVHSGVLGEHHAEHCGMMFAQYRASWASYVKVEFGLGKCTRIDNLTFD